MYSWKTLIDFESNHTITLWTNELWSYLTLKAAFYTTVCDDFCQLMKLRKYIEKPEVGRNNPSWKKHETHCESSYISNLLVILQHLPCSRVWNEKIGCNFWQCSSRDKRSIMYHLPWFCRLLKHSLHEPKQSLIF